MNKIKKIPYGISDFELFRTDNYYYVDKTKYIELLENSPRYLFLIRPRRFGKSLFLSILTAYYDVYYKDKFDFFFSDTYIGKYPTAEKNKYLILSFNFAIVDSRIENTYESFEAHCSINFRIFVDKYEKYFTEKQLIELRKTKKSDAHLETIFRYCQYNGLKLYIIIDEYDNFTNSILASYGQDKYLQFTKDKGFFKHFFNVIKGGTTGTSASISKMYITGVSPITLEDVTSGGIGKNITTNSVLNEFIGFTESEVKEILLYYKKAGKIKHEVSQILDIFRQWFGNYRFSKKTKSNMFNSTMVFNFLIDYMQLNEIPDNLIDDNTKIDYTKLQHLLIIDKKLNGNFSVLKQISEDREIQSNINSTFSVKEIGGRDNFVSLLYYFGLITIVDYKEGAYVLKIPNESIKSFFAKYIKDAYKDADIFKIDIYKYSDLVRQMTYHGKWQEVFIFLSKEVKNQTKIRDYISGESMIKGFLLAYLNLLDYYTIMTEKEFNKGFADLWLEPVAFKYPDIAYSYLIELKYFSRQDDKKIKIEIPNIVKTATKQLNRYVKDSHIVKTKANTIVKKIVLVYNAWELIHFEEIN